MVNRENTVTVYIQLATTSVSICKTGIILIVHKQTSALNGLHVANNYIVTVSEHFFCYDCLTARRAELKTINAILNLPKNKTNIIIYKYTPQNKLRTTI